MHLVAPRHGGHQTGRPARLDVPRQHIVLPGQPSFEKPFRVIVPSSSVGHDADSTRRN